MAYPTLEKLGFKSQIIRLPAVAINFSQISKEDVTNFVICELNSLRENNKLPLKFLLKWVCQLSGQEVTERKDALFRLNKKLKRILKRRATLKKNKTEKDDSFFSETFNFKVKEYGQDKLRKINTHQKSKTLQTNTVYTGNKSSNSLKVQNRRLRLLVKIKDSKYVIQMKKAKDLERKVELQSKSITCLESKIKSLSSKLMSDARGELKRLNEQVKYWAQKTEQSRKRLKTALSSSNQQKRNFTDEVEQLQFQIASLNQKIDAADTERAEMELRMEEFESRVVDLTKSAGNGGYTYTTETDVCIMELIDKHVPFNKVGPVIESVMKLCNVKPKHGNLPKKDYVAKVNTRKLALSHAQISETCAISQNQTLYSDETRKQGQPYSTFITTDEKKRPYLLGLRQMSTKASRNQLQTFKNILSDIEARKKSLIENEQENTIAFNILKNITSTMSDRAATQCLFNDLLETYRSSLLKEHIENYADLSEEDQHIITKMYNFFCGLHLLANIADLTINVFKEWESKDTDRNEETESLYTRKDESRVERAMKTTCKAFGPGTDEKNGVFLEFKTYLRRTGVNENYLIKLFIGNRFNILFHNGGALYHYHRYILTFLEDVKSAGNVRKLNQLLQTIRQDLQTTEVIQGVRALGILNKFVTSPLWKLMEDKNTHILDMNIYYKDLVTYMEDVALNEDKAMLLLTGEYVPFPSVNTNKDTVWTSLVTPTEHDALCVSILMMLCAAFAKAIKEKVKDHLEDGKYFEYNAEMKMKLDSVLPHNKLPEWAFGYLDWLIHHRPNSSRLANEAHLVFHLNKTAEWLNLKNETEIEQLMQWSKKEIKTISEMEKQRMKGLQQELERISREREEKAKNARRKASVEKESLTQEIVKVGLCQDLDSLDRMLAKLKTKKEQTDAVKSQIRFRQKVLEQNASKEIFQTSSCKGKKVSFEQLKRNLIILMTPLQVNEE